jgi:hypothetical protein
MKNDKDNYLLPLCHQDTKKGKRLKEEQTPHRLLIILCLLIVDDGLLIIIVIVGSMSGTDAQSG